MFYNCEFQESNIDETIMVSDARTVDGFSEWFYSYTFQGRIQNFSQEGADQNYFYYFSGK